MPNLEWWLTQAPDLYVDRIDHSSEIWPYLNNSGSAINKGAPCCLLVSGFNGIDAGIPAANNLALFRGVWIGTIINGALSNIPNGEYGLVQHWGMVQDDQQVGAARVLGAAGINAAGVILQFLAGNDYFEISDLIAEEVIMSGEAYTTASVALKKVWMKG